jgi:hypothetical protein
MNPRPGAFAPGLFVFRSEEAYMSDWRSGFYGRSYGDGEPPMSDLDILRARAKIWAYRPREQLRVDDLVMRGPTPPPVPVGNFPRPQMVSYAAQKPELASEGAFPAQPEWNDLAKQKQC